MKIKTLFSIFGLVAATAVSQAQPYTQVGTSSDTWNIDRTTELSGSQTSQDISDTAHDSSLVLNRYNGGLDLARVVITIIKPLGGGSSVIDTTLSNADGTGSNTFTSATAQASTTINLSDIRALLPSGSKPDDNTVVFSGSTPASNFTLNGSETRELDVNVSSGTVVWFDSATTGLTSEQLTSIFSGSENLVINDVASLVGLLFARSTTSPPDAQLNTAGFDTGMVRIDYYTAVPEPSSAALLLLGSFVSVAWLRRFKGGSRAS